MIKTAAENLKTIHVKAQRFTDMMLKFGVVVAKSDTCIVSALLVKYLIHRWTGPFKEKLLFKWLKV